MGGSHLAAGLVKVWNPFADIVIHRDYGLPALSDDELKDRLIIASSYSGNTEEVIDAYKMAQEKELNLVVISTGGELIESAKQDGIPYIEIPQTGVQPRSATGFSFKGILKFMGEEDALEEVSELETTLDPKVYEEEGKKLAKALKNHVPVIYSSGRNRSIAYNWKIKFNETGKIPAFYNSLPELNHNEMTGFDVVEASEKLSKPFSFIILKDKNDHPRTLRRMEILEKLYKDRKLPVHVIKIEGETTFEKIFSSLLIADWTAVHTAAEYGLESEQVPMVEEFKKLILE